MIIIHWCCPMKFERVKHEFLTFITEKKNMPQIRFSLLSMNCCGFFRKMLELFPVASSTFWNLEVFLLLGWLLPKLKLSSLFDYLTPLIAGREKTVIQFAWLAILSKIHNTYLNQVKVLTQISIPDIFISS